MKNRDLYEMIVNEAVPEEVLVSIRHMVGKRCNINKIAKILSGTRTSIWLGITYSPWIISYLIKEYNLDNCNVKLTDIERDILLYATDPFRTEIISKKYFDGTNVGFVENIYKSIGIGIVS